VVLTYTEGGDNPYSSWRFPHQPSSDIRQYKGHVYNKSYFFGNNTTISLGTGNFNQGTMSSVSFHDKHVSKDSTSKVRGNSFVKYSMFIDDTKVIMYKDEGTEFSDSTVYKVDSPEFWYHVDQNGGNVLIAWWAGNNPGATIRNLKVANYNPWVDGF